MFERLKDSESSFSVRLKILENTSVANESLRQQLTHKNNEYSIKLRLKTIQQMKFQKQQ